MDASDTGTGKTYVACAVGRELNRPIFAVTPKAVISSWRRAADHVGAEVLEIINYEKLRTGRTPWLQKGKKPRMVWNVPPNALLIFDEAHRCGGYDTQNAHMMMSTGFYPNPVLALSATLAHEPLKMRALGFILGFHKWYNSWSWMQQHGCSLDFWGAPQFNGSPEIMRRLHEKLFPELGGRIRISELGDAFPETLITTELLDLADRAKKELDAVYEELAATISSHAPNTMVEQLRLRQKVELIKAPAVMEIAEDGLSEGSSVVMFFNFRQTLSAVMESLSKYRPAVVHGDQTAFERERNILDFQENKARLILVMLQAGGVGLSLHDLDGNFPRLALHTASFSPIELRQALGRVHRAGGKSRSIQRILFAAGTVEERVERKVRQKLAQLDTLNDGDFNG